PRDDGYWILRANHFLGRRIKRCGWGTDKVIRLFRRDLARYQDREVHAEIDLPGPLPVLRHPLEHHSFRSFGQYWRKIQIYSEWGAAQLYKEGRRAGALQIFGRAVAGFLKLYGVRLGFLEGLQARGLRCLVAGPGQGELLKRAAASGLKIVPLGARGEFDLKAARRLSRILADGRIDLLHAHTAHAVTLATLATLFLRRRPAL